MPVGLRRLAFDPERGQLRVEVGYGLEEHFPDSLLAYLIEDHVEPFFRVGEPTMGLRLMIRFLHERIRGEMLGGRFDPAPPAAGHGPAIPAGGGVTASVPLGRDGMAALHDRGRRVRVELDEADRRHFGAQRTPEAAFRRYLEWLAAERFDPQVELFTPGARSYLDGLPLTRAYLDHVHTLLSTHRSRIVERGEWAMLYFTGTPLVSPLYFRKGEDGWQVDTMEEVRNSYEVIGHHYTWTISEQGESTPTFADLLIRIGRFVRVADGDNRPLPLPEERFGSPPPLPRELPATVIAEPAPPERNPFGYPRTTVDARQLVHLLRELRFAELEAALTDLQRLTEAEFRNESNLNEAYFAFWRSDPELEPRFTEWVARNPMSPEAVLARGHYRLARAWAARGNAWAKDTPRENFEEMWRFVQFAWDDGIAALRLDDRQLMAYVLLVRVAQLSGATTDAREIVRRGLEVSPHSYVLRVAMMGLLKPQWHGSLQEMQALAEEAEPFAEVNPRLRVLGGAVYETLGFALEQADEREEAIAAYTTALEYGNEWSFHLARGKAYFRVRDYESALEDLDRAWLQRPQRPSVLEWRGRTLYRLAIQAIPAQREVLLERAIRDLSLAQELEPGETRAELLDTAQACRIAPARCS